MGFRTDIQALRGLAVLLVLLHHAEFGPFQAGYLGVDIFFVISGYLITRLIAEAIGQGTFSFSGFYFRRAKRLLPAAYVTFLVTALVAPLMLNGGELKDFAAQLTGALTFTGNFVLLGQSGYFEGEAAFKPLLHVWSLAIEEQYYLLLPLAMVHVGRKYWLRGAWLILAGSLVLALVLAVYKPEAAFYLLPTRAWELAIGSVAALAAFDGAAARRVLSLLYWPALCALIVIPIAPMGGAHPGPDAIAVCLATAIVILRRHEAADTARIATLFGKVGDCSYSLYLVHWPVLAFLNNAYVGEAPLAAHATGLAISAVLGWLLYRHVELPVRHASLRPSRRLVGATLGASLGLAFCSYGIVWASTYMAPADYAHVRRSNRGFGAACKFGETFAPKEACRNSDAPTMLIWGDSYAMHLVPGVIASTDTGVMQAARSVCGPFLGLAPMDRPRINRDWAERCLTFNRSVLDYLAATPSIEVVVMSSPFMQYLSESHNGGSWRVLVDVDGQQVEQLPTVAAAVQAMRSTVEAIRALGKRAIIVAPPPVSGFDAGECLERKASGKLLLGPNRDCRIPLARVRHSQHLVHEFLDRVARDAQIEVVSFNELLCADAMCATELDGTFVYRDAGHLSYDGSRLLGERMKLGLLLQANAR